MLSQRDLSFIRSIIRNAGSSPSRTLRDVIVLVLVVVLDSGVARRCDTRLPQRLEGSRLGVNLSTLANFVSTLIRPKRAKTGGSRE